MMLLYPRLPQYVAIMMAAELQAMPVERLRESSGLTHEDAFYTPTGGSQARPEDLESIQRAIRASAMQYGYPTRLDDARRAAFDAESGRVLHQVMNISPSEASRPGVWEFLACVVLPDLVRWRFPGPGGDTTSPERFLGAGRGVRNTFGRVWWRAFILHEPDGLEPYALLRLLGEDELVQITERPSIAGNRILARCIARTFLTVAEQQPQFTRTDLLRDAMKQVRRLLPLVSFDALDEGSVQVLMGQIFHSTVDRLSRTQHHAGTESQ
jgi:Family of unknown function (DUF6339)